MLVGELSSNVSPELLRPNIDFIACVEVYNLSEKLHVRPHS